MHKGPFDDLQRYLLRSGVTHAHVNRITSELNDHLEDLRREAADAGADSVDAMSDALQRLGCQRTIARRILACREFRTWEYRYPALARFYYPLAYALLLPAKPLFAGMSNPFLVARWGAACMLGGFITAGMLLCMQLAIVLT